MPQMRPQEGFLQPHAMRTAQGTQWTSEGTLRTPAPEAKGKLQPQKCLHLAEEAGAGGAAGTSSAPTFVRVVQLEDVRVLGVIRQLHHPAHDGDLFARRGFVLENKAQPGAHTRPPLGGLSRPRQGSFPPPPTRSLPFTRDKGPARRGLSRDLRVSCLCPARTWLHSTGGWILTG